MKIRLTITLAAAVLALTACGKKIVGQELTYSAQGMNLRGYLAYDASRTDKRPGVLVVHEWWGNNEYSRKRAEMLADLGYVALAVDMYGEGRQAENPEEAGKMAGSVFKDFDTAKERFQAALDLLKSNPNVDPEKIAAIGYCFGGTVALNMARQSMPLLGVVSFHGNFNAVTQAKAGSVMPRMLVLHGADDKFIRADQIMSFKKEMGEAGADMTFIEYPGALHAFSNPNADRLGKQFNIPIAYNADADQKSWSEMRLFLSQTFSR